MGLRWTRGSARKNVDGKIEEKKTGQKTANYKIVSEAGSEVGEIQLSWEPTNPTKIITATGWFMIDKLKLNKKRLNTQKNRD